MSKIYSFNLSPTETILDVDLVVTSVTFLETVTWGENVNLSWTVTNQGNLTTSSTVGWVDSVYFSTDQVFDSTDTFITSNYYDPNNRGPLAPSNNYTVTRSIDIPADFSGSGYLLVVVDSNKWELETNEDNNTFVQPIQVEEAELPDLIVTQATSPTSVKIGEVVQLSWQVQNQGSAAATATWLDSIYVSRDTVFDNTDIFIAAPFIFIAAPLVNSPLAVGASYSRSYNWSVGNVTPGEYFLLFRADGLSFSSQVESNEGNNLIAKPITIIDGQLPDLTISSVSTPSTITLGEPIQVSWTVSNIGEGNALNDWDDHIYVSDDQTLDSSDTFVASEIIRSYTPRSADGSYTVNKQIRIPSTVVGDRYLLFVTDKYNEQSETDENNNVKAVPVTLNAPDLVVSQASAPNTAVVGQSINVSWTITNQGNVTAPADWFDYIYLSSNEVLDNGDRFIGDRWAWRETPLMAQGSYSVSNYGISIPGNALIGNQFLLFVADGNKIQGETNETNNTRAVAINLSASDLTVTSATESLTASVNEDTVTVSWTVTNQGEVTAFSEWYDSFYLSNDNILDVSDIYLDSRLAWSNSPLGAGATYTATKNIKLPSTAVGNQFLLLATDRYQFSSNGDNQLTETNENNNVRAIPITFQENGADLIISSATAPSSAILGESIAVSWTINNLGTLPGAADWFDEIYLSNNAIFDTSDILVQSFLVSEQTPLSAGGSYTFNKNVSLPAFQPGDNRYLIFVSDSTKIQGETNESNNTFALEIDLAAPPVVGTISALNGIINSSLSLSDNGNPTYIGSLSDDYRLTDFTVGEEVSLNLSASFNTRLQIINANTQEVITESSYTLLQFIPETGIDYLVRVTSDLSDVTGDYTLSATTGTSNLVISTATAPVSATLGDAVELSWTVLNQGNGIAQADWRDEVYLSTDTTLDAADTLVISETINSQTPLTVNGNYTITRNVNLPSSDIGDRYLLFVTDHDNSQPETSETDNTRAVPIQLTGADLVVADANAVPSAILGQSISVSWKVANQGNGTASADWYDSIYVSNDQVWDSSDTLVTYRWAGDESPLNPGDSYTITQDIILPDTATGDRYLLFVADRGDRFIIFFNSNTTLQAESNDNNNVTALPISLSAPNLVVTTITAPVEALSGQEIELVWTITNQGSGDAIGEWTDQVWLSSDGVIGSDLFIGDFSFSGTIAAGQSIERRQIVTVPIDLNGEYKFVITTDAFNQIPEGTGNQANNSTIDAQPIQIKLAPIPNLKVSNVTAPATAFSSQETLVQWTVTNSGTGATNASIWYDKVYLSLDTKLDDIDVLLGTATNPSYLNPGDSYVNSLTVTLPRGIDSNYYFLVKTDANNNVQEVQNEEDNLGFGSPTDVDLTPPPDLQVTAVNAPIGAFSGQPMSLSWTVTNKGTGRTLESTWYDRVFMSADETLGEGDYQLGDFYHSGILNAGENYTATSTVNLPIGVSGNYFFFVQTDINNEVYENAFESNNFNFDATATNITLTPPPDLEVELITIPGTARAGSDITINYRVTNFGATETPNYIWKDSFYLSVDNQFDPNNDVKLGDANHYGFLKPDEGYNGTATFTLSNTLTGNYYLFVTTDSENAVFELDNVNNTRRSTSQIQINSQPADLVVTNAVIPAPVTAGKAIRVQWTVTNQGIGDTIITNWTDRIIASTDNVVSEDDVIVANFERTGILNPNTSYSRDELVQIPFSLAGNYEFFVVTDANNTVYEAANETNNTSGAIPVTVERQTPDLQVTQLNAPVNGASGQPMTVSWTVQNLGGGRTNSEYWYDSVYLSIDDQVSNDDILLGKFYRAGALDPNLSYTATQSFILPIDTNGNKYVLVQTDSTEQVTEDNLDNNTTAAVNTTAISLSPVPDLVVQSVDAPNTAIAGQSFNLTWTVKNNSIDTGEQNWYDAFYLSRDLVFDRNSDIFLGYQEHNRLDAGASYTETKSFNIPRGVTGRFYVFAVTDSGNTIYERTGEQNNTSFDPFSIDVVLSPPGDLIVSSITVPANAVPGQNATISYTITNQGTNAAQGSWYDSIYLSADDKWDIGDALVGQVLHTGDVAAGSSYSGVLQTTLPGVTPGNYYAIVRSDIRNQVPENNEINNTGVSQTKLTIDVTQLQLGNAQNGVLDQGGVVYYRVDVSAGESLLIDFDSASSSAFNELYVSYGEMPTRADFDFSYSQPLASDQQILVPATKAGTYYIVAYGNNVPEPANYTIKADKIDFAILDTNYGQGGTAGNRTIEINGNKFDRNVTAKLTDGNGFELTAKRIYYIDSTRFYATFDLTEVTTGIYV